MTNTNITWARAEIAKHKAAIADLETYIRVEETKDSSPHHAQSVLSMLPPLTRLESGKTRSLLPMIEAQRGAKKLTILSLVEAAAPNGLRTSEIVQASVKRGLVNTTMANTSPQLSQYGSDGLVVLDDGFWKITNKGREYLAQKI